MTRDWRLDQITWQEFERLVAQLCQEVLGTGAVSFSNGPDGGRDGRFSGRANRFPSDVERWDGEWVIQAKHTSDRSASCSDGAFYGNKSSIVASEIERLTLLRSEDGIDCYVLVTNRTLAGGRHEEIRNVIKDATGIPNVHLIARPTLDDYLERHPFLAEIAGLHRLRGPLRFGSAELRVIIEGFGQIDRSDVERDFPKDPRISAKNEKNRLSERYFEMIESKYAPYFHQVRTFLRDPINADAARKYEVLAAELNVKVLAQRDDYARFDQVFTSLYDRALELAPNLARTGDLVWLFLHFMYWDCDVGEV